VPVMAKDSRDLFRAVSIFAVGRKLTSAVRTGNSSTAALDVGFPYSGRIWNRREDPSAIVLATR